MSTASKDGAKAWLMTFLKGLGMGAANVIPGVSGGTVAFITGIYERLVNCIDSIDGEAVKMLTHLEFKKLWKHVDGGFLLALMAGVAVATLSLAKLMLILLEGYPVQTWAFFFGLILASSAILIAGLKMKWGWKEVLFLAIGAVLGVGVCSLSGLSSVPEGLWYILVCGAVSICAMILPGISGSYLLMVMGRYEYVMDAISRLITFDGHAILVVAVFALGCVAGLLMFGKLLHWLLDRWNRPTLLVLSGFVLGSLTGVWPWAHSEALVAAGLPAEGYPCLVPAIIWCMAGAAIVLGLEWLSKSGK